MAASEETIQAITAYLRGEADDIQASGEFSLLSYPILSAIRNGKLIAEIPATKPTVPDHVWQCFPWCKAIAKDFNNAFYLLFENENPEYTDKFGWGNLGENYRKISYNCLSTITPGTCGPEDSLVLRPEHLVFLVQL